MWNAFHLTRSSMRVYRNRLFSMESTSNSSTLWTSVGGGGGQVLRSGMGSGGARVSFTIGNTGCRRDRERGSWSLYAPCPTCFSIVNGPSLRWVSFAEGLVVLMSLASNHTLSPGLRVGAGVLRRL